MTNKRKRGRPAVLTLCWDCKNATMPWKCPWVEKGKPVDGWTATKTRINNRQRHTYINSYHVTECPLFDRNSYEGGMVENVFGSKYRIDLDRDDTTNLAEEIIQRAIGDWNMLKQGRLNKLITDGITITKAELLEFFFSEWFTSLLESFSQYSPEQIRSFIHITEDMRPEKKEANKPGGRRLYYQVVTDED